MFLELIKTFVREKWVETIDADDLILVNKSYVLQDFSEKEADVVYRLKKTDKRHLLRPAGAAVNGRLPDTLPSIALHGRDLAGNL
ncbi:hypothetical protein [Neomoorella thermoacetica]|uniref:hypothetical protein n=1 Tax=Neomoorella thermoacetica TaxID=1525 RepID=UPI0030CC48C0